MKLEEAKQILNENGFYLTEKRWGFKTIRDFYIGNIQDLDKKKDKEKRKIEIQARYAVANQIFKDLRSHLKETFGSKLKLGYSYFYHKKSYLTDFPYVEFYIPVRKLPKKKKDWTAEDYKKYKDYKDGGYEVCLRVKVHITMVPGNYKIEWKNEEELDSGLVNVKFDDADQLFDIITNFFNKPETIEAISE